MIPIDLRFPRRALCAAVLGGSLVVFPHGAAADLYDRAATEDAAISDGLPDKNLDWRHHSENSVNLLLNTSGDPNDPADDYFGAGVDPTTAQEYMIFKFDFSGLSVAARPYGTGTFHWRAWFTLGEDEGIESEAFFGDFTLHEITAGDADWRDNNFSDPIDGIDPGAVTFNSLGGTFSDPLPVHEVDVDGKGELVPGQLISNGGFESLEAVEGIPRDTLARLMDGSSVGLAMAGVGVTNFSIHPTETFPFVPEEDYPRLTFGFSEDPIGDMDRDGDVDFDDIIPFALALNDPTLYESNFGIPPIANGDTDQNGRFDFDDIPGFVALLGGGDSPAARTVPEPSTVSLLLLALWASPTRRRRQRPVRHGRPRREDPAVMSCISGDA